MDQTDTIGEIRYIHDMSFSSIASFFVRAVFAYGLLVLIKYSGSQFACRVIS